MAGTAQLTSPFRPICRSAMSAAVVRVSAYACPFAITQLHAPADAWMSHTNAFGAA